MWATIISCAGSVIGLVYFGSTEITFGGNYRALFLVDIYCLLFVEKEKIKVAEFGDFHYLFIL